jgi:hypothetical protein
MSSKAKKLVEEIQQQDNQHELGLDDQNIYDLNDIPNLCTYKKKIYQNKFG